MGEKERTAIKNSIRKLKKEVLSSNQNSLKFLIDAGLCYPNGSLRTPPKR